MLMDLFFKKLPLSWRKKRIHFHDLVLNVHSRLQKHKGVADPLEVVAGEISDESVLLCLDKFMQAEQCFYFIEKYVSGLLRQKFEQLIGNYTAGPKEAKVVMGRRLQTILDCLIAFIHFFGWRANLWVPQQDSCLSVVTLIDVMHENKSRLMCTAEGTPLDLFERIVTISDAQNMAPRTSSRSRKNDDFDLCVDNELGFAKDRTVGWLTEMNSIDYLEQHAELLAEQWLSEGVTTRRPYKHEREVSRLPQFSN